MEKRRGIQCVRSRSRLRWMQLSIVRLASDDRTWSQTSTHVTTSLSPLKLARNFLVFFLILEVYCDPMGGQSVVAFLPPGFRNATTGLPNGSIVASARVCPHDVRWRQKCPWHIVLIKCWLCSFQLDTFSLFLNTNSSADTAASGIVALLATIDALSRVKNTFQEQDRPIMFAFLNGVSYPKATKKLNLFSCQTLAMFLQEAFEYIGSTRLAWDMEEGNFPFQPSNGVGLAPINPADISHYVELSQLGRNVNGKLFFHTDPLSRADADTNTKVHSHSIFSFQGWRKHWFDCLCFSLKVQEMLTTFTTKATEAGLDVEEAPTTQPLPPASAQTFLRSQPNIPTVVFSDHDTAFSNV